MSRWRRYSGRCSLQWPGWCLPRFWTRWWRRRLLGLLRRGCL